MSLLLGDLNHLALPGHMKVGGKKPPPKSSTYLYCYLTLALIQEGKGAGPEPHSLLRSVHKVREGTVPPGEYSLRFVCALSNPGKDKTSPGLNQKEKIKFHYSLS